MRLVQHHVLELLVKDGTREDVRVQRFAIGAIVEDVLAGVVKAVA